jgi:small subunit ribosomal protein S8
MPVTDPIADMLTCIRNAIQAGHRRVDVPASKMKKSIVEVLLAEKFIKNYKSIEDAKQGVLRIYLKYNDENASVIKGIKRVSRPGRRVYVGREDVPRVLRGLGTAIVSTPNGVITDKEARKRGVGGEVVATVW